MGPRELFDLYYAGDETAQEVFDYCTEMLARGLANVFWNFDPDVVVVGGSIDLYHPIYLEKGLEKAARYLPSPDALHIEKAIFGDDAGLIGAALLVRE
jgi:predicted NBD/HSP70 family sugar kinase